MDSTDSPGPKDDLRKQPDLPFCIWAILPLAAWLILAPIVLFAPGLSRLIFRLDHHGGGLIEHGTVLILLPGIAAGITVFVRALRSGRMRLEKFWFLAWALACIYFAGEEISWGQHFFQWSTPEAIESLNDQQETNLHNISSWLDQKPRALVEAWIILGGLFAPLWIRFRNLRFAPDSWQQWILPTIVGTPAAASTILTRIFKALEKYTGASILEDLGDSEFREFFIALFLTLYLLSACYRQQRALQEPA